MKYLILTIGLYFTTFNSIKINNSFEDCFDFATSEVLLMEAILGREMDFEDAFEYINLAYITCEASR